VDILHPPAWNETVHRLTFQAGVTSYTFSRDGRQLLTACMDGRCFFWDPDTGKQVGLIVLPSGYAEAVAFSPDGNAVLLCATDGSTRLWDTKTSLPLGPTVKVTARENAAFNAQGSHFLIQSDDRTHVYQQPEPVQGTVDRLVHWAQVLTGMELDNEGQLRVLTSEQWIVRRQRLEHLGGNPRH
jgi:WD40 repeat protein